MASPAAAGSFVSGAAKSNWSSNPRLAAAQSLPNYDRVSYGSCPSVFSRMGCVAFEPGEGDGDGDGSGGAGGDGGGGGWGGEIPRPQHARQRSSTEERSSFARVEMMAPAGPGDKAERQAIPGVCERSLFARVGMMALTDDGPGDELGKQIGPAAAGRSPLARVGVVVLAGGDGPESPGRSDEPGTPLWQDELGGRPLFRDFGAASGSTASFNDGAAPASAAAAVDCGGGSPGPAAGSRSPCLSRSNAFPRKNGGAALWPAGPPSKAELTS
jgi:hypothetical protein